MGILLLRFDRRGRALTACLMCLVMVACVSGFRRPGASEYSRTASYMISQKEDTSVGRALANDVKIHKNQSGFMLLPNGEDSLRMRMAMVMAAEKTLDLQYYIMHDDDASNLVLEALLRAAERGVRVRFLLDNISLSDVGKTLSILDSNPNIQVRVFNPMVTRRQGLAGFVGAVFRLDKALKRMHNKALITDNHFAITGGRNIGDEYFDAHNSGNFKDMDLVNAGPIVNDISQSFDEYWNSDEAFPLRALRAPDRNSEEVAKLRAEMKKAWQEEMAKEKGDGILSRDLARDIKQGDLKLIWAPAEFTADHPAKVDVHKDAPIAASRPAIRMAQLVEKATKSFDAVSAYFVPGDEGVQWFSDLEKRGVHARVLTNSLASTDVVAVHTGYRRYREDLVKAGVDLYEFKPIDGERPRQRLLGSSAPPRASLHSKMYVIDSEVVLIGSYNLDPRSTELNTEVMSVIHSKELAAQVLAIFEESIAPSQSYHIQMSDRGLVWVTQDEAGKPVVFTHEPGAGIVRNVEINLFSLLPIEDQL
jgi:putative cardiolipin synthase